MSYKLQERIEEYDVSNHKVKIYISEWSSCVGDVIDKIEVTDDWISVKDRLPEIKQEILVFGEPGIFIDEYNGDMVVWATHWMPLPEPPESEE